MVTQKKPSQKGKSFAGLSMFGGVLKPDGLVVQEVGNHGGLCSYSDKQKEVKKLIQEEGLHLCAILETHVKYKNIKKTCETVFGDWEYITNGEDNNKGCRIMIGWNDRKIRAWNGKKEIVERLGDPKDNYLWNALGHTWISLHMDKKFENPKFRTLKKLDRVMVNEAFMDKYQQAHGVFLPYMISDHSPIIVRIPNGVQKRKSSFRFSNFITDKEEVLPTVRSVWYKRFEGHTIYRVVQKMKALKRKLKQLNWRNGNVFERVEELRKKVKESQNDVNMYPHDERVKEKSCVILKEYHEAIQDEYSLLCQKAKVEWLKEGDRNTAYFHKTIKEMVHRGRIMTIRNEEGVRFKNDEALKMARPISDYEIKNAMFEIEDSKARWLYLKVLQVSLEHSWERICKPKDQGGLGLKNLGVWMIKHLWNIATKKDTLWVKWITVEKLKGRSIWEVQNDCNSSVGWKNILSLRDKARDHIWWKIGNGRYVNVWHDTVSPLSGFIETRDVYDAWLSNNCIVSEIIHEGRWLWPEEWSNDFEESRQIQIPSLNDENEDTAVWVARNGQEQQFKISNVWKDRIYNDTKVDWFSMVWFAQSIPRHAFVTWLAIQKRLMTQDKLLIWRPNDDFKCALCNKCPDSHNHLFFTCDFSKRIWNELLKMLNVRLCGCWDQIIDEMKALPANRNIWSIVRRLVCCASVYYIWQERNNRLFKNEKRDNNTILNTAKETLGMKLIGIKVKESRTVKEVEERWNVKMQRG
ncbi:RNA-directed DNA polymerase, eukaryota, reverse transcriptase zinc-binding domain protein [Tanacetum coccineum]